VFCDEHGTGGSGEFFGDNNAHLDIISAVYHEASGGKYVPRAVLFDLEPDVIDALRASSLGCLFRPGKLVGKSEPKTTTKELSANYSDPPRSLAAPTSAPFTFLLARNARAYTSTCSIGLCATWVCISSIFSGF